MTAPTFCAACGAWLDYETHQCSELWLKGKEIKGGSMGVDLDNPNAWGDVEHVVWCNADRRSPVGCAGCSCPTGRKLRALRAENAKLWAVAEAARCESMDVGIPGELQKALDVLYGKEEDSHG